MHSHSKKIITAFAVGIGTALISTILRILLMTYGFDSETQFYNNNILATVLYCFVMVSAVIVYLCGNSEINYKTSKSFGNKVLDFISAIIFIALFVIKLSDTLPKTPIGRVTHWISVISIIFSVLFYLASAISANGKKFSLLPYLNIAPIVYLICSAIDCFTLFSIKANSYYMFPHVLSILITAFYVLNLAKVNNLPENTDKIPMFSYTIIVFQLLAFSFIPDVLLLITDKIDYSSKDILLTVLKGIYLIASSIEIITNLKAKTEDRK